MSYFFISVFVPLFILVPFGLGIISVSRFYRSDRLIFVYIVLSGVVNAVVSFMASRGINNMPVFHIFTVVEFTIISLFYMTIYTNKIQLRIVKVVLLLFILFSITNSFFIQPITSFNTYSRSLGAIILILYCVVYFQQLISTVMDFNNPNIWYASGIFIYFSSSFLIFIMSNLTLTIRKELNFILWNIHGFMVLLMYIFISFGFHIVKRNR